jgi:hypothetical protein
MSSPRREDKQDSVAERLRRRPGGCAHVPQPSRRLGFLLGVVRHFPVSVSFLDFFLRVSLHSEFIGDTWHSPFPGSGSQSRSALEPSHASAATATAPASSDRGALPRDHTPQNWLVLCCSYSPRASKLLRRRDVNCAKLPSCFPRGLVFFMGTWHDWAVPASFRPKENPP